MTTATTRSLEWRPAQAAAPADAPAARPAHWRRPWMGKPLSSWPTQELKAILVALEITAYGHVVSSDDMDCDALVAACGELDAEMDRRRSGRACS